MLRIQPGRDWFVPPYGSQKSTSSMPPPQLVRRLYDLGAVSGWCFQPRHFKLHQRVAKPEGTLDRFPVPDLECPPRSQIPLLRFAPHNAFPALRRPLRLHIVDHYYPCYDRSARVSKRPYPAPLTRQARLINRRIRLSPASSPARANHAFGLPMKNALRCWNSPSSAGPSQSAIPIIEVRSRTPRKDEVPSQLQAEEVCHGDHMGSNRILCSLAQSSGRENASR